MQIQGVKGKDFGWLSVKIGNMFGGKTEGLITELRKVWRVNEIRGTKDPLYLKIRAYKHAFDKRYEDESISTHPDGGSRRTFPAKPISLVDELVKDVEENNIRVIGIDEIQFFQEKDEFGQYKIVAAIERFLEQKRYVIVAGLNRDFRKKPFGPIPYILGMALSMTEHYSICSVCGAEATETQRLINGKPAKYSDPIILVGAADSYEPRCVKHHQIDFNN